MFVTDVCTNVCTMMPPSCKLTKWVHCGQTQSFTSSELLVTLKL